MAKEPTQKQIVMQLLRDHRETMRAGCKGIGEPAVEIPIGDISVFNDSQGEMRAIMPMDKLVYLIDRLL